jgi:hypothetical protein
MDLVCVRSDIATGRCGILGRGPAQWALTLNGTLAGSGVYAGHVAIGVWIAGTPGAPEGAPLKEPDDIARLYWVLHTRRASPPNTSSPPEPRLPSPCRAACPRLW